MALPTLHWNPLRTGTRFDPFTDMEDIMRNFGSRMVPRDYERTLEMRLDVDEDERSYRVTVDVPGVRKEDIDVSVEGNQVTITAEVKREESRESDREVHRERFVGKAYRSFALPGEVDSEKAQASYDNGVLNLTLPKKGDTRSRRLSIS